MKQAESATDLTDTFANYQFRIWTTLTTPHTAYLRPIKKSCARPSCIRITERSALAAGSKLEDYVINIKQE
jgi:hypothetical protein